MTPVPRVSWLSDSAHAPRPTEGVRGASVVLPLDRTLDYTHDDPRQMRPRGGPDRMRIYDGSARQDFEEVFRSIGAFLDQRGMKDVLLLEAPDGFIVQGLVSAGSSSGTWSEAVGTQSKETLTFLDDDIARFMEEAGARRGSGASAAASGGHYESAFRVIGRYMDDQKPRDVFFFEQEGAFVLRLLMSGQAGSRHELAEFTRDDITDMVARGPSLRHAEMKP